MQTTCVFFPIQLLVHERESSLTNRCYIPWSSCLLPRGLSSDRGYLITLILNLICHFAAEPSSESTFFFEALHNSFGLHHHECFGVIAYSAVTFFITLEFWWTSFLFFSLLTMYQWNYSLIPITVAYLAIWRFKHHIYQTDNSGKTQNTMFLLVLLLGIQFLIKLEGKVYFIMEQYFGAGQGTLISVNNSFPARICWLRNLVVPSLDSKPAEITLKRETASSLRFRAQS